jgi:MoaA/NifB/PqqE/SkfB family radical SAM enzyme
MNDGIVDILMHGADDFKQILTTNGTGFGTISDIDTITECCKVIRVSVDAATRKTYKRIRGVDTFERAVAFIERVYSVKNARTELSVSFMLSPFNYREAVKATRLFKNMGVDGIVFKFVHSEMGNSTAQRAGFSTAQFLKEKRAEIETILARVKREETDDFKVRFRHPAEFADMKLAHQKDLYRMCRIVSLANPVVLANGDLQLCCDRRGDMTLGNLISNGFWDVWHDPLHAQFLKSIWLPECPARCKLTEMNQIVEAGFLDGKMMWELV